MWTPDTPASEMLRFEVDAYKAQGIADPAASCRGIVWWMDRLKTQPEMTAEQLRLLYEAELCAGTASPDWARGLLTNQGHLLHPAFRATMIAALPDGALAHMVCEDFPFTDAEKQSFKERIRGRFQRHPNYGRIAAITDG